MAQRKHQNATIITEKAREETQEVVQAPPTQPEASPNIEDYDYDTLFKQLHSKSNVIRFLTAKGFSRSAVAKFTGLRYQHVRNVLLMPVTKPRD